MFLSAALPPAPLALVLRARQTGKFALHVLAGALESAPDIAAIPVEFPAANLASQGSTHAAAVFA